MALQQELEAVRGRIRQLDNELDHLRDRLGDCSLQEEETLRRDLAVLEQRAKEWRALERILGRR